MCDRKNNAKKRGCVNNHFREENCQRVNCSPPPCNRPSPCHRPCSPPPCNRPHPSPCHRPCSPPCHRPCPPSPCHRPCSPPPCHRPCSPPPCHRPCPPLCEPRCRELNYVPVQVNECRYIYPSLYDVSLKDVSQYGNMCGRVAIVPPTLAMNPCISQQCPPPIGPCSPRIYAPCPPPIGPCSPRIYTPCPPPIGPCSPRQFCGPGHRQCEPIYNNFCGYCEPCLRYEPCINVQYVDSRALFYDRNPGFWNSY